jgi:6,7-dimethyl-8-ribityllumazine synthase
MSFDSPSVQKIDGARLTIGIVAARFNSRLVDALLAQAQARLLTAGVLPENLHVLRVPGSAELPYAAQRLCENVRPHVVLALGVIVRGDTIHYHLVAEAAQQGLLRVGLDTRTPVITGIVVAETQQQAEARCLGEIDRGSEFAHAALEMAALQQAFRK